MFPLCVVENNQAVYAAGAAWTRGMVRRQFIKRLLLASLSQMVVSSDIWHVKGLKDGPT